jgi:hypothetical protein
MFLFRRAGFDPKEPGTRSLLPRNICTVENKLCELIIVIWEREAEAHLDRSESIGRIHSIKV